MELATVAISALGTLFAAIAAWGAVMTVRLTREMMGEANISRVIEALISIEHAVASRPQLPEHVADEMFLNAQRELVRVAVLPWVADMIDDATSELIEKVINADLGDRQAWDDASVARSRISTQPPPKRMPPGYIWIAARLYGYRQSSQDPNRLE
jgi:hypothetical protein